jgi:hypothetical protein
MYWSVVEISHVDGIDFLAFTRAVGRKQPSGLVAVGELVEPVHDLGAPRDARHQVKILAALRAGFSKIGRDEPGLLARQALIFAERPPVRVGYGAPPLQRAHEQLDPEAYALGQHAAARDHQRAAELDFRRRFR